MSAGPTTGTRKTDTEWSEINRNCKLVLSDGLRVSRSLSLIEACQSITVTEWNWNCACDATDRKYEDGDAAALKQVEVDWGEEYAKGEAADAKIRRRYTVGVLTGSVTPFWSTLQAILTSDPEINQADSVLQVSCATPFDTASMYTGGDEPSNVSCG